MCSIQFTAAITASLSDPYALLDTLQAIELEPFTVKQKLSMDNADRFLIESCNPSYRNVCLIFRETLRLAFYVNRIRSSVSKWSKKNLPELTALNNPNNGLPTRSELPKSDVVLQEKLNQNTNWLSNKESINFKSDLMVKEMGSFSLNHGYEYQRVGCYGC